MTSASTNIRLLQGSIILAISAAFGLVAALGLCSFFDTDPKCAIAVGLVCVTASLVSLIPLRGITPQRVIAAYGISTTIRVSIIALGVIALVSVQLFHQKTLAGWMIYWYLTFLVVEVTWLKISLSPREMSGKLAGGQTSC